MALPALTASLVSSWHEHWLHAIQGIRTTGALGSPKSVESNLTLTGILCNILHRTQRFGYGTLAGMPKATFATLGIAQFVNLNELHMRSINNHGLCDPITGRRIPNPTIITADLH